MFTHTVYSDIVSIQAPREQVWSILVDTARYGEWNPFTYRGSLGPWPVVPEVHRLIETLGRVIAGSFGLVGLFGIDLILRIGRTW